jgi:APA family basic amino acid/polyamine antiporter
LLYYDPDKVQMDWTIPAERGATIWQGLLVALIGVLWSFGGWHHASYLAGEAQDAQRTVPRAMVLGALIVTVTYVLVNLGYMLLLPLDAIAATTTVAGDAVSSVPGMDGRWVAVAIGISVFGTIGIYYTTSAPRIYYAMAKDGLFFPQLARVHDRFQTPAIAMIVQAVWSILLLFFWGTFYNLISYVTFMDIAFMAMAGASVFVLRKKRPDAERPYRVWGYPVVPAIFVGISGAFVINTLFAQPAQAWAGLVLLGLGIAGYYFVFRK